MYKNRQSLSREQSQYPRNSQPKEYSFESKYSPYKQQQQNSHKYDDNEGLIEYELKRERQKTRILEERLKNKEIFIEQMKQFQVELTAAFDQSQEELEFYKQKSQQHNDRQYLEQIAQLKHTLVKLQQENRRYVDQLNQFKNNQNRPPSRDLPRQQSRGRFGTRYQDSSQKKQHYRETSLSRNQLHPSVSTGMSNKIAKILDYSQDQINGEAKRIGKFLFYFLSMVASCNKDLKMQQSLKQRLKFGWKWIRDIVKESAEIKEQKATPQIDIVMKILKLRNRNDIVPELESIVEENKKMIRILSLVMDEFELPPDTSLKRLENVLRDRLKHI